MKYAWIENNKLLWPVCVQCRVLGVSASGYRQHLARRKKLLTRRHLSERPAGGDPRVYTEHAGRMGGPACASTEGLRSARGQAPGGACDAAERAARPWQRRFRYRHRQQPCSAHRPNLLARRFTVDAPNTVWAGDMTYIPTREGWLYLAWCSICSAAASWLGHGCDDRLGAGLPCARHGMA